MDIEKYRLICTDLKTITNSSVLIHVKVDENTNIVSLSHELGIFVHNNKIFAKNLIIDMSNPFQLHDKEKVDYFICDVNEVNALSIELIKAYSPYNVEEICASTNEEKNILVFKILKSSKIGLTSMNLDECLHICDSIKFMTASEYANMNEDNYNYVYAKSSNEIGIYHVIGDEVFDLLKNIYFISKKKFEEVYKLYEKLTKRDFQIKFAHYIVNGVDREKELTQYDRYWISTPKELFILIWDKYIIKYYTDTIKTDMQNYLRFDFYASYSHETIFTDVTLEIDGLNVK
jgi:hypothetical protein